MRLLSKWSALIACLVATGILGGAAAVLADDLVLKIDPIQITIVEGSYYLETPSSRYITGRLGVRGHITLDENARKFYWLDPWIWGYDWQKTRSTQWDIPGRWAVRAVNGDPETEQDDDQTLNWWDSIWEYLDSKWGSTWPCYYFGYWKLKVGDKTYLVGDAETGSWSKWPYPYETPPAGSGMGRAGGYVEGEWTVTDGSAAVASLRIKMSAVRDQVRFELTLTNRATATQNIGLQMVGDTEVGDSSLVGNPCLPGVGFSRQPAALVRPIGTLLSGGSVPEVIDFVDNVDNPGTVARLSLKLQDCVAPDYVAVGEYREITDVVNAMWLPGDYDPDPLKPVDDIAWAACWAPRSLGPSATRKIVTYYGMGAASTVWNYRVGRKMQQDSVALALQGPRSMKYNSVDGINDLAGQPFTVKAYLYNLATDPGPYDLNDVTATLYLPPGLELTQTPAQEAQQLVESVPVSTEKSVEWTVQATGEYSGELEYFVTARADSGWQQVVSRKVMVPATKKSVFRSGYQMMHVPFTFNNQAIEHAFGLPRGSFGAKYYDPATGQYLPVTQLKPGQAFWMYVGSVQKNRTLGFQLAADAAIVGGDLGKQVNEQDIDLQPGWNLVGNPFLYPVYWGQVLVWSKVENVTVSLNQAVSNGWLSKTVFTWVPESGTYDSFKDNSRLLLPWRGYWVRAKYPVTLVIRPSVPLGSDVTASPDGT